ncbi:hypothetical protein C0J52_26899 [Blattella germanica]|nr:hypothetical protein C0J52_26899 [Blattella germanica]
MRESKQLDDTQAERDCSCFLNRGAGMGINYPYIEFSMFFTTYFHVVIENNIRPVKIILYYFNRGPPKQNEMLRSLPVYAYKANWKKHKRHQNQKRKLLRQVETETKTRMSTKITKDSECLYCKGLYSMSNECWVSCVNGHITRAVVQTVMMEISY